MNEITKDLLEALKMVAARGRIDDSEEAMNIVASVIVKAEAALAEPQGDADGWIPWSGGECPIPEGMAFDLRFRDGVTLLAASSISPAAEWGWNHERSWYVIIAYRIVKESDK